MTRGLIVLALAAAILPAVGFVPGESGTAGPTDDVPPLPVQTTPAQFVDSFATRRTFTGVIKARRESELGFQRTGRLAEVLVSEGERVNAGDLLARLDTANLQARQQELQAERSAAASLLAELEAGPREQTIAAARAEVRDLQAQADLEQLNYQRRKQLVERSAISQEELDRTTSLLDSLQARLAAAQARLEELEAGTRPEQIAAQQATVERLDAALQNVAVDLDESALRAPFAGWISQRQLDEGAIVSPGRSLFRLVETGPVEAWIGLPVSLAAQLAVGESVSVLVDQVAYEGRVTAVAPELDSATRTRTVICELRETDQVVPGQLARLELPSRTAAAAIRVPTTALLRGSRGLWSVLVAEQTTGQDHLIAARRDVEVLYSDGQQAFVRGTLQADDLVITNGSHRVVSGQRVAIAELEPAAFSAAAR